MKNHLVKLRNKLFGVNAVVAQINDLKAEIKAEVIAEIYNAQLSKYELENQVHLPQDDQPIELNLQEGENGGNKALKDCQLNVYNFTKMQLESPAEYDFVRFDPNNNCNLHCVYCHNPRTSDIIDTEDFRNFLENNIISVNNFQIGCIMEPTLDSRICDLMLMVANSPAKPQKMFMLQTNGILLDKHDFEKMKKAGLTHVSISVDAAEPDTQKVLRSGTSLKRVISNVKALREACPEIKVIFITTVTTANIHKMEDLINLGIELGVKNFVIREVFYDPENGIVDHEKMPSLLLKNDDFSRMKQNIIEKFGTQVDLLFADNEKLKTDELKMREESFLN